MKFLSNLRSRMRKNLLNDKRGQGATEYILLLVVVVGLVMLFKTKIAEIVGKKMGDLGTSIGNVNDQIN